MCLIALIMYTKIKVWISWADFLGTNNLSGTVKSLMWVTYDVAEKFARSLKLNSIEEWRNYYKLKKLPKNIPKSPDQSYKNKGWISWGNFLGTGNVANQNRDYHLFENAKKVVKQIGITTQTVWRKYVKKNKSLLEKLRLPANPPEVYSKDWISWGDWFGTERVANREKIFLSFNEVRIFAHTLNFKNRGEWEKYSKSKDKPDNIPANPGLQYKNKGWISWGNFLGTGNIATNLKSKNYLPSYEGIPLFRKLVKENKIYGPVDWILFARKNKKLLEKLHLPAEPVEVYSKDRVWRKMKDE